MGDVEVPDSSGLLRQLTVRNHINHVFDKLDLHERSKVIVRARETGLGHSR